ncbi:MAG: 3-methyl-2-oxobutanoate hydroxymethyltransferase [Acidobacteriaceae bacterium]|nr:3-methyl-2-oxobutanoate hydroxymethyltransferase [Acidobacteriaceae bacterium]
MSLVEVREADARPERAKVTSQTLLAQKQCAAAITALTAYDYPTARLVDEAGIDMVLVGDSVGMTVLGYDDTLAVTMDDMVHHARAVRRGTKRAMLVVDMPFGSYQVSLEETMRNALRLVKEAGVEAVKLEGGAVHHAALVRALTEAEIPVVGHIGLTPQSVHRMGGYRVQGRSVEAAARLREEALRLEDAGVIALVLEGIPRELAREITADLAIPTIGIGAGPDCDGQILVFHDLFELSFRKLPKFVRSFGDAGSMMQAGLAEYRDAVQARTFPADAESYHAPVQHEAALAGVR